MHSLGLEPMFLAFLEHFSIFYKQYINQLIDECRFANEYITTEYMSKNLCIPWESNPWPCQLSTAPGIQNRNAYTFQTHTFAWSCNHSDINHSWIMWEHNESNAVNHCVTSHYDALCSSHEFINVWRFKKPAWFVFKPWARSFSENTFSKHQPVILYNRIDMNDSWHDNSESLGQKHPTKADHVFSNYHATIEPLLPLLFVLSVNTQHINTSF